MPRFVALLRGINVGGHHRVAMADLRALLHELGHADVATYLQSGNAVFTAEPAADEDLAAAIASALAERLGFAVPCVVRGRDEVAAVIAGHPLADMATDDARMQVHFLSAAPDPARLALHDPARLAPDRIRMGERVIYQWCPDGVHKAPPVGAFVERHLGVTATARNWKTVTKLLELLDAAP